MYKPLVDGFQKLHNLSIEEVKENFQYAGDDSEGGKKRYYILFGEKSNLPAHSDVCVCGHKV